MCSCRKLLTLPTQLTQGMPGNFGASEIGVNLGVLYGFLAARLDYNSCAYAFPCDRSQIVLDDWMLSASL
jgi:hypothetical protein